MNLFDTSEHNYWRNAITRTVLVICSVTLIVWFMPRVKGKVFHYDIGKPWSYSAFIASFDFPVYKSEETINKEKDSLRNIFQPYYNYNASTESEEVAALLKAHQDGQFPNIPPKVLSAVVSQLHHLYKTSIISAHEFSQMSKDSTKMIRIVTGKQAASVNINKVYSTRSAYEHLLADATIEPYRMVLQKSNLVNYIRPNLEYDRTRSESELNDILSSVPIASGMVVSGQKIIDRGDIVNEEDFRVLSSFEREMERRDTSRDETKEIMFGQIIFVLTIVVLFTTYLRMFRRDYFTKPRSIFMLYIMLTLFPILVSVIMVHNFFSVYIIPFCLAPIFVRMFMDSRTAFITHTAMILICAAAVKYQYEFIIIQLISGLVAIYSLRELSRRSQLFNTALLITVTSAATYFSLQLMQSVSIGYISRDMYMHFFINGIFLLLAYPLMYVVEKTFGFTSDVTLFELSNTNKGVLRDLSEIAPGTFQHSITVGNLAATIANRIGANSLLVRTGALYHDIGKIEDPVFFTENQNGMNPSDDMPYKEAARIITSHVPNGVKIAEKYNLPQFIKDFILTHHGKGVARYFYVKYQNEHEQEVIDKEAFSYPGPNPSTREQAILMMADACEAASRSLNEYTNDSISQLVNRIIDQQTESGFFRECPITFRDIELAKSVLIERLKAIYHTRISYPELKKNEK